MNRLVCSWDRFAPCIRKVFYFVAALVLVASSGCGGPDSRKPFVGVWRLDSDYFKEQLEKQSMTSDEAMAALKENIPLWKSFKTEYTFSADGRYQMSTQLHDSNVATERGKFEVSEEAKTLKLTSEEDPQAKTMVYRFVNDDTLELDLEVEMPGYPKTARFLRAKAEEMNAKAEKKGSS